MMVTRSQAAIPSSTVLVADVMLGLKLRGCIVANKSIVAAKARGSK